MCTLRAIDVAAILAWAGPAVAGEITLDGHLRYLRTYVEIRDDGTVVGQDDWSLLDDAPGPFDHDFLVSVGQQGVGSATAHSAQISSVSTDGFVARGSFSGSVFAEGGRSSANAFAANFYVADFSVTGQTTFDLFASIAWAGDPQLVSAKLRKTTGGDLFVLGADGPDGSAQDGTRVTLQPGTTYEFFCLLSGHNDVNGPGSGDAFSAEYSISLTPIPTTSVAAALGLGLFTVSHRRRSITGG